QLEDVLSDIQEITGRTAEGRGTLGRLTEDEDLASSVAGAADGLSEIIEPISRLQTIVGIQSEYNFLANSFKNYFELRIQPREDAYYLFQLINDPRGLTEYTQTTVRRSPPAAGEPAFSTETRVTTRDAFRFSLMIAKRIHFATFRFGILESTGGVGTDLHFVDDRLEVTGDVFALGEQAFPRLRLRAAFEIISKLWVIGGIDDALNSSFDFFLGLRLRFNDEDLKSILPFAGGLGP
ncbi:MAG: MCE family protein, partial [Myxococcales bacterium]|nr:MCE family protein [Myxococcales bacterium]